MFQLVSCSHNEQNKICGALQGSNSVDWSTSRLSKGELILEVFARILAEIKMQFLEFLPNERKRKHK